MGHIVMNLPARIKNCENDLPDIYKIADENIKIMYSHFQRYCYLLSEHQRKTVIDYIQKIDEVVKHIINGVSGLQEYNRDEIEDVDESFMVHTKNVERIIIVTEFEEMYYALYRDNLSELSDLK